MTYVSAVAAGSFLMFIISAWEAFQLRKQLDEEKQRNAALKGEKTLSKPVTQDTNLLVHTKGDEKFVLVWRQNQKPQAIRTLADWADDKDINFDWSDYSRLVQKVRTT